MNGVQLNIVRKDRPDDLRVRSSGCDAKLSPPLGGLKESSKTKYIMRVKTEMRVKEYDSKSPLT